MKIWTYAKKWLPGVLILALLCSLIGSTYAKYVKQQTLENTVTIKANLGKIELLEHEAVRLSTGEYDLTEKLLPVQDNPETTDVDETDLGNEYILLPGLDIPKNPFVRISGKTPIEAYVFVEVVDNLPANSGITYSLTADWTKLEGVTGAHGGTVYVYKDVLTNAFGNNGSGDIPILAGDTVYVSQKLDKSVKDLKLTFYASMYEVASGSDEVTVYNSNK